MLFNFSLFSAAIVTVLSALPQQQEQQKMNAFMNPYQELSVLGESHNSLNTKISSSFSANLNIFVPPTSFDSYALILFFPGFGSNIPSLLYEKVLGEIAAKGVGSIVLTWDGLLTANPLDLNGEVGHASDILSWAQGGNLQSFLSSTFNKSYPVVDTSSFYFMGHSSGNQIAVRLAENFPSSSGLILLDPVDSDPLGFTKPVITGPVNYSKPVLVVASGLGEVRGIQFGNVFPPCCPPGFSSEHFYNAFQGSTTRFFSNATYYGHSDLLSPDDVSGGAAASHFCASVSNSTIHPFEGYRNFVSGQVSSFIGMLSTSNQQQEDICSSSSSFYNYLTNQETFSITASSTFDLNGNIAYSSC